MASPPSRITEVMRDPTHTFQNVINGIPDCQWKYLCRLLIDCIHFFWSSKTLTVPNRLKDAPSQSLQDTTSSEKSCELNTVYTLVFV